MYKAVSVILLFMPVVSIAQHKQLVHTSDIDHFWIAYDSVQKTNDSITQVKIVTELYVNKGTEGLHAFMQVRDYSAAEWVRLIRRYPKFWNSIRPNTLTIFSKADMIESSIRKLAHIYPALKPATIYFTIGGLRSGGTTLKDKVLIGSEIATGDAQTDVSEFNNKWIAPAFRAQEPDNIVALNVHEYIHTQQRGEPRNLLGQAIKEGACDFVTELVMERPLRTNYMQYGLLHESRLKEEFKREMFSTSYANWLYNGAHAETADLGYFIGYAICKAYYGRSKDKNRAVKNIIELNYSDSKAVKAFLHQSGYY
jgi:hypothetical protein